MDFNLPRADTFPGDVVLHKPVRALRPMSRRFEGPCRSGVWLLSACQSLTQLRDIQNEIIDTRRVAPLVFLVFLVTLFSLNGSSAFNMKISDLTMYHSNTRQDPANRTCSLLSLWLLVFLLEKSPPKVRLLWLGPLRPGEQRVFQPVEGHDLDRAQFFRLLDCNWSISIHLN